MQIDNLSTYIFIFRHKRKTNKCERKEITGDVSKKN